jgi:hypothetical protein
MHFISGRAEFERALAQATENGLRRAAIFTVSQCKAALSVVNPGRSVKYKRPSKSGAKSHTVYGTPSSPEEPPRQRTGHGKGMVSYEELREGSDFAVRVGVPKEAIYLGYHEVGIKYRNKGTQRRPWLVATVEKYAAVLAQLFTSGAR